MARFFLHALGRDRPGIVAALAEALARSGANLEDSRMTILQGWFAVMLVLDAGALEDARLLERALEAPATAFDLTVGVRRLEREPVGSPTGGEVVAVSVHGADHPGIVAQVAGEIARAGGNVVDLASRRVEGTSGSTYVLLLSVELAPQKTLEELRARLTPVAEAAGVVCTVSLAEAEVL